MLAIGNTYIAITYKFSYSKYIYNIYCFQLKKIWVGIGYKICSYKSGKSENISSFEICSITKYNM